ncbi:hypothetical protein QBC44DRAFT_394372 [Cladorrhinum sp. PSN332]|nr:hypothetical protein QBC44DRAFT_394372 [Cladorrhinum sp. PSN332]
MNPDKLYQIKLGSKGGNNHCLAADQKLNADSISPIRTRPCSSTSPEIQWQFVSDGGTQGLYFIYNMAFSDSGRRFDLVLQNITGLYIPIMGPSGDIYNNQRWSLEPLPDGDLRFNLRSFGLPDALLTTTGIAGDSFSLGAVLRNQTEVEGAAAGWLVVEDGSGVVPASTPTTLVTSVKSQGVVGASTRTATTTATMTVLPTPQPTTTTTTTTSVAGPGSSSSPSLPLAAKIGLGVGVSVFVLAILLILLFCRKCTHKAKSVTQAQPLTVQSYNPPPPVYTLPPPPYAAEFGFGRPSTSAGTRPVTANTQVSKLPDDGGELAQPPALPAAPPLPSLSSSSSSSSARTLVAGGVVNQAARSQGSSGQEWTGWTPR